MNQFAWSIPALPTVSAGSSYAAYNVAAMVGQTNWGSLQVIDLAPNAEIPIEAAYNAFIEVLEGYVSALTTTNSTGGCTACSRLVR